MLYVIRNGQLHSPIGNYLLALLNISTSGKKRINESSVLKYILKVSTRDMLNELNELVPNEITNMLGTLVPKMRVKIVGIQASFFP